MATPKVELTRLKLDNLEPAPAGKTYEIADTHVRGLRVRVGDSTVLSGRWRGKASTITFVMVARFPPSKNPTRRAIGRYDRDGLQLSLHGAREKAGSWRAKIAEGIDPSFEDDEPFEGAADQPIDEAVEEDRKTVENALDGYETDKLGSLARGAAVRRALDGREGLLKTLLDRDIKSVTRGDIAPLLKARKAVAPVSANRQLAYASAFFNWCIEEVLIDTNPVAKIKKPSKETSRDRHHSLSELKEIWAATGTLGYPFQQLFRLLIVLPMRREENAAIKCAELTLGKTGGRDCGVWELGASRTKKRNALRVPITPLARSLIREAMNHPDRPSKSPFVFSTTENTSVSGFSKAKKRLDAAIQENRAAVAAKQNVDLEPMPHWTLHDLRTTFNTISCDVLGIDAHVTDRILNHVATATTSKVMRIYNRSELFGPRKKALLAWSQLLERKVMPGGRSKSKR
jgi:integrase